MSSRADALEEYQVKAAFLYHFASFVNWPSSTFNRTNGHFHLCIIGNDPFGKILDSTLRDKKIHEHAIDIHRNPSKASLRQCHLLYVTALRSSQLSRLRNQFDNTSMLTVGENDLFIQHGGMITFFMDNQKVRFAINPDAINKTALKVSSKLLRLAKIVSP